MFGVQKSDCREAFCQFYIFLVLGNIKDLCLKVPTMAVENIVLQAETPGHQHFSYSCNSLPNNKIFDVTKLKAFEDSKLKIATLMISLLDRVENTV